MSEYTKDDALELIDSLRLTIGNRVGFKWLVAKLNSLAAYIESINAENERLNASLDRANARNDRE